VVVGGLESSAVAEGLVDSVGGSIDVRPYLPDVSAISAHTEAPGLQHGPAYVALYCHRRARRAGHVDLLDMRKLVGALDADELAMMTDAELHFPWPGGGVRTTMLSSDADGNTVTRLCLDVLAAVDGPLGEVARRLAHRIGDLFGELSTRVANPAGSLLIWDNQRVLHARSEHRGRPPRLTEFWSGDRRRS
jgi:hypothetical protein